MYDQSRSCMLDSDITIKNVEDDDGNNGNDKDGVYENDDDDDDDDDDSSGKDDETTTNALIQRKNCRVFATVNNIQFNFTLITICYNIYMYI